MPNLREILIAASGVLVMTGTAASSQTLTVDEFRRELVGLPLCGTPPVGPLAGKALCTVHLPDGTAILAGSGILVRGVWDVEDGHICRRNAHDAPDRRRCVDYVKESQDHYRNSDNVEFCIGPCLPSSTSVSAAPSSSGAPQRDGNSSVAPPPAADAGSGVPPPANPASQPSPSAGPFHQEPALTDQGVNAQPR